ncbi:MAG: arginine--tRNA ligase [Marinilabiliales bacterium]|nr:arginine--tRNA ligase [Marinilabiliales bacterium]
MSGRKDSGNCLRKGIWLCCGRPRSRDGGDRILITQHQQAASTRDTYGITFSDFSSRGSVRPPDHMSSEQISSTTAAYISASRWWHGRCSATDAKPEDEGVKGDHFVGDFYVLFEKKYREQISELVAAGINSDEARENAPLMQEARRMLLKWEAGDPETVSLWHMMDSWVYEGFDVTYKALGVEFDKIYYESETYRTGKELVLRSFEEGHLIRKDDGSVWMDLSANKLDQKLLLRSDGTAVYMTQDLGTAVIRYNDYHFDRHIYVVGNEQNYHFQVLALTLRRMGYEWAKGLHHFSYGMVELPEGRMKSREGTVVDADDLITEMTATATAMSQELGKLGRLQQGGAGEHLQADRTGGT